MYKKYVLPYLLPTAGHHLRLPIHHDVVRISDYSIVVLLDFETCVWPFSLLALMNPGLKCRVIINLTGREAHIAFCPIQWLIVLFICLHAIYKQLTGVRTNTDIAFMPKQILHTPTLEKLSLIMTTMYSIDVHACLEKKFQLCITDDKE